MLILGRKLGEGITFDGPAEVVLHKLEGGRISLAIRAPNTTKVLRSELVVDQTDDQDAT